ncbi:MAG: Terminase-like family protein [bacterium ADurb.Bin236]|nr:MAG: Terminase-like family protein [bacterium ADurb.Bin236]
MNTIEMPKDHRAIGRILRNPRLWGEHYLKNRDGAARRYWPHQHDDLECPATNIIHLDGRDSGKTVDIATLALHHAFVRKGGSVLVAAPHQGPVDTIVEEVEFQIENNPDLQSSIAVNAQGRPKITRKPYFKIEFTNGSVIYFRPAGAYGDPFRSLHVELILVDEGAWLTEKAWKALRQCLKAGGRMRIYSTPNGLRDTTYYRLTHSKKWKVFRWPSWLNPDWTPEREDELVEFYGGRDTAGWQHEVAGEHGRPSYGAFNLEHLTICRQDIPEYVCIDITGDELKDCETEEDLADRLDMLLDLAPVDGQFWIGGDLGYTADPTEIVIFREASENEKPVLRLVRRIHMERVAYPHIAQAIALLDKYLNPAGIGVDAGGNGLSVVQELTALNKYKELNLSPRLRGYNFGSAVVIGENDGQEIKKRCKEYMTSVINKGFQSRQIILPASDVEVESQFTTHTYSLKTGNIIYSKGNDHIVDAVRCAVMIREQGRLDELGGISELPLPVMTNPIFN